MKENKRSTSHPENFCWQCGHPNVTWYAPNELWNKLCKGYEIICPRCFQDRADKDGINLIFTIKIIKNYENNCINKGIN